MINMHSWQYGNCSNGKKSHMYVMLQRRDKNSEQIGGFAGVEIRPVEHVQRGFTAIVRASLAALGALLIPLGIVIAFLTPILPIGLPIVILGVVLLARNAVWGRRFVQGTLRRHPGLERYAPDWLLKLIFGDHHKA